MSDRPAPTPHGRVSGSGDDDLGRIMRRVRRLVLRAVAPELTELRAAVAESGRRSEKLEERAAALDRGLGGLVSRLDDATTLLDRRLGEHDAALGAAGERLEAAESRIGEAQAHLDRRLGDVQAHLDARLNQAESERGDVRSAFLAARGELERLRDEVIPGIERRIDATAGDALAVLQRDLEELRDTRVARLEETAAVEHAAIEAVQGDIDELRERRVAAAEAAVERLHAALVEVQASLEELRDTRLPTLEKAVDEVSAGVEQRAGAVEKDLAALQRSQEGVQELAEEVRDERLPALSRRTDALIERLHEELTVTAGLVDRMLAAEPLQVAAVGELEGELPEAIREASARFLDTFRGGKEEILERVAEYLPHLADAAPVLDLGCGRGELLAALQDAGIAAAGVDSDPAMIAACRRAGLEVEEGDVLEALRARPAASLGAVTAIHVLEHLPAAAWMSVVAEAARSLRTGGLLIIECPNPESLRVGGALFWLDPTHHAPIHPEAISFVARAVGLEVAETLLRRPFPADQMLARSDQPKHVRRIAEQLDSWLSGPRDFAVIARKP